MISDERMEKALRFLAETDLSCAEAKANMERAELKAKRIKQTVFLYSTGTAAERNATAEIDDQTVEAFDEYAEAVKAYAAIANKRETEKIVIDVWRSVQANRRQG